MESEKYICVREQATTPEGRAKIVIVELSNPTQPTLRPITVTADLVIMNPDLDLLAVKGPLSFLRRLPHLLLQLDNSSKYSILTEKRK
jgi:hypothetical protein